MFCRKGTDRVVDDFRQDYTIRFTALCFGATAADQKSNSLPFRFEQNTGQTDSAVKFVSRSSNYTVFLAAGAATLRSGSSVLRMTLVGANPDAKFVGIDSLNSSVHYLIGNSNAWNRDVPVYERVEYRNVYPNIDVVFYGGSSHRLEYDLILHPQAEPSQIRIRFECTDPLQTDSNGDVVLRTAAGEWRHTNPKIYQIRNEGQRKIEGRLVQLGPNEAGFDFENYDHSLPLVIDPALTYSTYLGGSGEDTGTSIAVDGAGNAYVTGWTESLDFPETTGTTLGAPRGVDAYVAKLSPGGSLLYLTYLGGSGQDQAYGIAVDGAGSAVIAGTTYSTNFPTLNAAQPGLGGGQDGFVAKLNPAGNGLVFSTYLGGSGADSAAGVSVDPQGNIYVAGGTASANFPVRSGLQLKSGGGEDAFLTKFSSTGAIVYSTYLGGAGNDNATAVVADASGAAYLTGGTSSPNFPVANAFQPTLGGGQDAFAAKIGPAGNTLLYSTYLGGSGGSAGAPETGNGIAVDSTGCAYIAGATSSSNFPTANPLQSALGGSEDAFILKLSATGSALVYSARMGGSSIDVASAVAVDLVGRAYIAGYTASTDFPIVGALQSSAPGGYEDFLARLNSAGTAIQMGTYVGGTGSQAAYGIALDSTENVYIAGQTTSTGFPVSNGIQTFPSSPLSTIIFKIPSSPSASASFVKLDANTQGNWKSAYGADGWAIPNDSASYPTYVQMTNGSQFQPTSWAASTNDARALQDAYASGRIASLWGAWSSFTMDVNLIDGATHQIALYCLDWDSTTRSERIDVLDAATGLMLDTRTVSSFNAGQYLVWNVSGHATFRITLLGGVNTVVSGVFLGGAPPISASFVRQDLITQGSWKSVYGADGWAIPNDSASYPAYVQVTNGSQFQPTSWAASTNDARALQDAYASGRIASLWGAWSGFTIDVNLTDGATHQIALYCLDWDSTTRSERIDVLDAANSLVLDSRTVSSFNAGQYLVWNVSGHVTFRITLVGGINAVISGVFFGGAPPISASFVKQDFTTQGSWKGVYGVDGWAIPDDTTSYPAYAQVTIASQFQPPPEWAVSYTDVRALQETDTSSRIASLWGAWSSFTIDVNLTDGATHQIALYCLDWDSTTRSERIDVLDAATGLVLDTRTVSSFNAGQYIVWNVTGQVT